MKRYNPFAAMRWLMMLTVLAFGFVSCSDSDNDEPDSPVQQQAKLPAEFKDMCTTWGYDAAQVKEKMGRYTLVTDEKDVQEYANADGSVSIAYEFTSGAMRAAALIKRIDDDAPELTMLSKYLSGYTELGRMNDAYTCANEKSNSLAMAYTTTGGSKRYQVIALTPLNSSLYDSYTSVGSENVVETVGFERVSSSKVTLKGKVKGVSTTVNCGFQYSSNAEFRAFTSVRSGYYSSSFSYTVSGIKSSATMYFRAFATVNGVTYVGEIMQVD